MDLKSQSRIKALVYVERGLAPKFLLGCMSAADTDQPNADLRLTCRMDTPERA